jgi:hypothetical protein
MWGDELPAALDSPWPVWRLCCLGWDGRTSGTGSTEPLAAAWATATTGCRAQGEGEGRGRAAACIAVILRVAVPALPPFVLFAAWSDAGRGRERIAKLISYLPLCLW